MSGKKKIPCRVCGKEFEPCSYCQTHTDVFRWRNFACSLECARKYINNTIKYREEKKKNLEFMEDKTRVPEEINVVDSVKKIASRKNTKKTSKEILDNKTEDKETI